MHLSFLPCRQFHALLVLAIEAVSCIRCTFHRGSYMHLSCLPYRQFHAFLVRGMLVINMSRAHDSYRFLSSRGCYDACK